ncbi:MAG: DNA recombination protein RmuC [Fimbriimonadaceae bacterium]
MVKQADAVLKQYKEVADGDEKSRRQEIEKLLDPMREKLKALDEQNQLMERNRQGAYSGLMEQVKSLSEQQVGLQRETSRLTKALQDPGSAGQWGEMLLEQVVEMAGPDKHMSYETPEHDPDGRRESAA